MVDNDGQLQYQADAQNLLQRVTRTKTKFYLNHGWRFVRVNSGNTCDAHALPYCLLWCGDTNTPPACNLSSPIGNGWAIAADRIREEFGLQYMYFNPAQFLASHTNVHPASASTCLSRAQRKKEPRSSRRLEPARDESRASMQFPTSRLRLVI